MSSGEDDLEKDGKEDDQKSGSEGGDPDNDIIQNTTDSKVGFVFGPLIFHYHSLDPGAQDTRLMFWNSLLQISVFDLK